MSEIETPVTPTSSDPTDSQEAVLKDHQQVAQPSTCWIDLTTARSREPRRPPTESDVSAGAFARYVPWCHGRRTRKTYGVLVHERGKNQNRSSRRWREFGFRDQIELQLLRVGELTGGLQFHQQPFKEERVELCEAKHDDLPILGRQVNRPSGEPVLEPIIS